MKWTLADVWGVVAFVLMIAGITGLALEVFREDGWGSRLLGVTAANPMVVLPVVLVGGGVATLIMRGKAAQGKHPFSDALVYLLVALGVYFIYRWLTAA